MLGTLNTHTLPHQRALPNKTVNGQRQWPTEDTQKLVGKVIKSEQFSQRELGEELRFRYTVYLDKRLNLTEKENRLQIDGKWYLVVGNMGNGKYILQ